jgi:redox-sensitive bicupin YhaK (pirin superfamily)
MNRRIHSVLAARRVIDDGDMLLYRALPAPEPAYASWRVADIPVVGLAGGQVRVIAGFAAGAEGPMKLTTATTFVVVRVEPGATMTLPVDAAAELGLYVLDGHLVAEGGMSPGQGSLAWSRLATRSL